MILPYFPRLVSLCLAAFFLVHLVVGLAVTLVAPRVIRMLGRVRPRVSANWLLALRMLPAGVAIFVVTVLCVPSYLELEPDGMMERVGGFGLSAAVMGLLIGCISIARAMRAIWRSSRYARYCEQVGRPLRLPGERLPVWVIEGVAPLFALVGIFHPRLVISRRVLQELSAEQLAAVLRHERGHRVAHDNFKRLLVLLSPDWFPLARHFRGLQLLNRSWASHTEWAADDSAAGGDPRQALSLAEALVRTARVRAVFSPPLLVSSFIADGHDYSVRVERLLGARTPGAEGVRHPEVLTGVVIAAMMSLPMAAWIVYALLPAVYRVLEALIG